MKKPFLGLVILISMTLPISTFALTQLVSVDSSGTQGNSYSIPTAITSDGKYVLFYSYADNLVPNDTNGTQDVFVRDTVNNTTTMISVDSSGTQGNSYSIPTAITSDGKYVLFYSYADNLVPNDTNGTQDVFVRDTVNNTITMVNVDSSGTQGNGYSMPIAITSDGRYVLFNSNANNLVPNDTNGTQDVFVRDTVNNTTTMVSVDSSGTPGNDYSEATAITADGKYVLFNSDADNLVANDTNGQIDIFVRDTVNNTTTMVSVDSSGTPGNGYSTATAITADGRYVLFNSDANNLVPNDTNGTEDAFVRDTVNNTTTMVSVDSSGIQGNDYSEATAITADGRYVLFYSSADNLVANDTNGTEDAFVRDTVNNTTTMVSVDSSGIQGNDYSEATAITADGRYVLFNSSADNLVANDTNGQIDIFVRDTVNNTTTMVNVDSSGIQGNDYSEATAITADGRYVLFYSSADNLVSNDTNGTEDAFVNEWQNVPITAPSITTPGSGSYIHTTDIIMVQGVGLSGADIKLGFLGNNFFTTVDSNSFWSIQLPGQLDGMYALYVQQKNQGSGSFGLTGMSNFIIDTIAPPTPIITSPVQDDLLYGYDAYIEGEGEPFATVIVKIGNITMTTTVDEDGYWSVDSFVVIPLYQYSIVAKQVDLAGNQSDRSDAITVYGEDTPPLTGNYSADLFLIKQGVSYGTSTDFSIGSTTVTTPNATIRYTLEYNNVGHGDATGVVINETIPMNTCYTLGSISGLNDDYVVQYSNNNGTSFSYMPIGITGQQDCTVTNFRIVYTIPFAAHINAVSALYKFYTAQNNQIGGNLNPGDSIPKQMGNLGSQMGGDPAKPGYLAPKQMGNLGSHQAPLPLSVYVCPTTGDGGDKGVGESKQNTSITGYSVPNQNGTCTRDEFIMSSTGDIINRDKLFVSEEVTEGENSVEYGVYGVNEGSCDTGVVYIPPTSSTNGEIDIHTISGSNTSICVMVETATIEGGDSPVLGDIIATWNNEDVESFTFDVRVKSGSFVGNTITNTAYITSNTSEANTGDNTSSHTFNLLLQTISGGGFGGRKGGVENNGGGTKPVIMGNTPPPIVKEIDTIKPSAPVVIVPPRNTPPVTPVTSVVVTNPTTPNSAIKEAMIQTTYVSAGTTVEVKTPSNPVLGSEKKCYTPKEVVDITLGKNTTYKDQLVYQALLKSYNLTIFSDTDEYMPENGLKRYEAAKMFTNFAKYILCRQTTKVYNNEYTDIEGIDETLKPYIIQAYEYGILQGSQNRFRPLERISRKEFIAALMRMFINKNMDIQGVGNEWDKNYQEAFKSYELESIVGVDEEIDRYDMSKIIYKLYYNTQYEWTEKGYILPYSY